MRKSLLAAAALGGVLLAGCGATPAPPVAQLQPSVASTANPFATQKAGAVAEPVRVRIPSIGVDASIVKVGLKPNNEMVTPPFGKAGWYSPKPGAGEKPAPRPGEAGPAVIAGHVDSRNGPDVFAKLKRLKQGAKIVVTDKAENSFTFVVDRKPLRTAKTELPAKKIWGATSGPALRLITCGGEFDKASGHYLANWTIFASAA